MSSGTFRYVGKTKDSHGRRDGLYIDVDASGLEYVKDLIDAFPERVAQSVRRTMQATMKGIKTDTAGHVMKKYAVRSGDIKSVTRIRKSSGSGLTGEIRFMSRQLNLASFSARPTRIGGKRPRKGVSVLVNKEIGRFTISGAFMARLYNTSDRRPRLYRRKDYGTKPYTRFPLIALRGPSIAQMVNGEAVEDIRNSVIRRWQTKFIHEMTEGYKHVGRGRKK